MDQLPANVQYITNDTEQSFSYMKDGIRTNLSILGPAGNEPACIQLAQYKDGQDDPVLKEMLHISSEEKALLIDLLTRSTKFI